MGSELDAALRHVGQFGRYQGQVFLLLGAALLFMACSGLSYVFTAADIDYRCRIPGCDDASQVYRPHWLPRAVPLERRAGTAGPSRCLYYERAPEARGSCPVGHFLNSTVRCTEWLFEGNELTIVSEWNITCEENAWKLSLVGTSSSFGQFVGTPLAGVASDRFGRKAVLIWILLASCLVGVARTFSPNYVTFVILEFVNNIVGGNVLYGLVYVLGIELVGPDRRILAGLLVPLFEAVGEMLLGLLAWWILNWRVLLQVIYGFGFLLLSYHWLLPESVRWLMVQGRVEEAKVILRRAAKINGVQLSSEVLEKLDSTLEEPAMSAATNKEGIETTQNIFRQVIKSKQILLRVVICSLLWISSTFVYYGLSLNSVSVNLTGNKFANFVVVSSSEIPACFLLYPLMTSQVGRRPSQCCGLLLAAFFCFAFTLVPAGVRWLNLTLFLLGKLASSVSFGVLYLYTVELFPTSLRHSLYGVCAMMGRLGTVLAPQTPLLAQYMESLPLLLFGTLSLISALLALLLPETKNTRLPDTIQEVETMGRTIQDSDSL